MARKFTTRDVLRIAVEVRCDPRTARRALQGKPVREMTEQAVRAAAAKLGIRWPDAEAAPREEDAK